MKNKLAAVFGLLFLATPVFAGKYYDNTVISTTTQKATVYQSGDMYVYPDLASNTTSFSIVGSTTTVAYLRVSSNTTLSSVTATKMEINASGNNDFAFIVHQSTSGKGLRLYSYADPTKYLDMYMDSGSSPNFSSGQTFNWRANTQYWGDSYILADKRIVLGNNYSDQAFVMGFNSTARQFQLCANQTLGSNVIVTISTSTRATTFSYAVSVPSITVTANAGTGKVLTSDANGNATWQTPSATGGVTIATFTLILNGGGGDVFVANDRFCPITGAKYVVEHATMNITGIRAFNIYTSTTGATTYNVAATTDTGNTATYAYVSSTATVAVNTKYSPWVATNYTANIGAALSMHITGIPTSGTLPSESGIIIRYWRRLDE